MTGRRSASDERWNDLRDFLKKRDRSDRLVQCLTIAEAKRCKTLGQRLDCAHLFAVSSYPEYTYEERNVYRINNTSHRWLDEYKSPISGDFIDRNRHFWWWWRIAVRSTEKYDETTNYEELCLKYVKRED